jgi:glycosyltransferase involved in cell wall biosynthesis
MNSNPTYLSIVIPVYNEEDNVKILYQEIRNAVDPSEKNYELIFIDDGSTDKTFESLNNIWRLEENQKECLARTKIIRFSRNFGQTAAMQAGFDHAGGKIIVSLDGDLQNDPADIPKMLKKIEQGFDLVCGWRKDRKDKRLFRVIPSKMANWLIRRVTGVAIHDTGCSLKAYRGDLLKSIRIYSDMHRFIPAISTIFSTNVSEIVVNHRPRRYGQTKYGLSRIWQVLFDIITIKMLIKFNDRPILWFAGFGVILFLGGIAFGIGSFYQFLNGRSMIVFGTSSILFFFLFGSLMSWGTLAEYFLRIENRNIFFESLPK